MKYTIPFVCAALTGTTAFAQESLSQPITPRTGDLVSNPVDEVFFAFGSWALPFDMPDLTPIVKWADSHPGGMIVLDGNACTIGPDPYNIRLSARRAEAVRDRLVSMGVDGDQIVLAVYGENGLRRTTMPLDRRVTIWTTHNPLHAIVDSSLVRGKAVLWSKPVTYAEIRPSASPTAIAIASR